jgi:hypothetical protein
MKWFTQPLEDDKQPERVYWLHGVAGCGKSTVAKSVAQYFESQHRCVSFFFNASDQVAASPRMLYSTISRKLADMNHVWKASLLRTIKGSTGARESGTVKTQFETLIQKPAENLDNVGPILIIIDAIDESGQPDDADRKAILQTLKQLDTLPRTFRFLITSRSEDDIATAFRGIPWVYPSNLGQLDQSSINEDIRTYIQKSLWDIQALRKKWNDVWVERIVGQAGQLFQWAVTACKYIEGDGRVGLTPLERLDHVLTSNAFGALDHLYTTILTRLCPFTPGDRIHQRFRTVMGRVLLLREPLPLSSIAALRPKDNDYDLEITESILLPLGSLLRGVSGGGEVVQPLHASFKDFLLDKERSGQYWIDLNKQRDKLPNALLREMHILLKFNICNLESSYCFNRDIAGLDDRTRQNIPSHLSYACRFWGDHLGDVPFSAKLQSRVFVVMRTRLLFWLEVLSLLGNGDCAMAQIVKIQKWLSPQVGLSLCDILGAGIGY